MSLQIIHMIEKHAEPIRNKVNPKCTIWYYEDLTFYVSIDFQTCSGSLIHNFYNPKLERIYLANSLFHFKLAYIKLYIFENLKTSNLISVFIKLKNYTLQLPSRWGNFMSTTYMLILSLRCLYIEAIFHGINNWSDAQKAETKT